MLESTVSANLSRPALPVQLLKRLAAQLKKWGKLLRQYLKGPEEQVDLLLTLEEFCDEEAPFGPASNGRRFVPIFPRVGTHLALLT